LFQSSVKVLKDMTHGFVIHAEMADCAIRLKDVPFYK